MDTDYGLHALDLGEHLDKLQLTFGQTCAVAGITKMQLDYWTLKARIPTHGRKQRLYDADALETVLLIKQARDNGFSLAAAIDAAHAFKQH